MSPIPITFEFNSKKYIGYFSQVMGAGSNASFHLMVDGFYYGQLFYSENNGWQFFGHVPGMEALSEEFGYCVTAWLDSH